MKALTLEYLRKILHYDPETGVFTRLVSRGKEVVGCIAGGVNTHGYIHIQINDKRYLSHRLAWFYVHGVWPEKEIDFINGIKTDCRMRNLREATRSENEHNKSLLKNNTSGVKGVCWSKKRNKWQAYCWVNGKNNFLGRFTILAEAERVVRQFREEHLGEFANHGDVRGLSNA